MAEDFIRACIGETDELIRSESASRSRGDISFVHEFIAECHARKSERRDIREHIERPGRTDEFHSRDLGQKTAEEIASRAEDLFLFFAFVIAVTKRLEGAELCKCSHVGDKMGLQGIDLVAQPLRGGKIPDPPAIPFPWFRVRGSPAGTGAVRVPARCFRTDDTCI